MSMEHWQLWGIIAVVVIVGLCWIWDTIRDFWSVVTMPFSIVAGWLNLRKLTAKKAQMERENEELAKMQEAEKNSVDSPPKTL